MTPSRTRLAHQRRLTLLLESASAPFSALALYVRSRVPSIRCRFYGPSMMVRGICSYFRILVYVYPRVSPGFSQ
ncbi:hypothetical protein BGZ63DRAFT_378878 [Mariannaea sp. PMI_226]|nr:hypothetical protein BGZ63DRAFT_378878 [Mariannaea sp. PMI_226]